MQGSTSHSETLINRRRSSSALRLFLAASLALLWLVAGGGSSPARAQGPALWMASPSQGAGTVGGLIEIRPYWLTVSGAPHKVKLVSGAAPLANATGLAFAPSGAMWVSTLDNRILKFRPGQLSNLAINPHPTPVRRFTNTAALELVLAVPSIRTSTSGSSTMGTRYMRYRMRSWRLVPDPSLPQ